MVGESISGSGSEIDSNKYRIIFIGDIIKKYNIKYIYDICGDCNWQHKIYNLDSVIYFGTDISNHALSLAKQKNMQYKNMIFTENAMDLTKTFFDEINDCEKSLIIIKEVIQHLSFDKALKLLKQIKYSGIKYILITNHNENDYNVSKNYDIHDGSFYPNNIFMYPFNFKNPIENIDDFLPDDVSKGYGNLILFNIQEQDIIIL